MDTADRKPTFGVVVGTRGLFNPELAREGRRQLLAILDSLGISYVIPPEAATPTGAIETRGDAHVCASLFRERRDDIDGIVVILPNFGDELGVAEALHRTSLNVPVLVQACNDDLDKLDLARRRDAFCGKLSVCNNLYQYGIRFTDTQRHTCKIESEAFAADLAFFASVCRVVRGLRSARIGAIGARPAAFQTVRCSEKLLQAEGITVVTVDLSEIIARAQGLGDGDADVRAKAAEIKAYGRMPGSIPADKILKQARLRVAIERWMEENGCVASAVQCWTSIQEHYGCAACLSMSMMGEKGMPSACEVDIGGAVSMYALLLASGSPPGFLDWNNNYAEEPDMCINTHCSSFPRSFVAGDIEISNLDVLGESLGRERCFGAIKGQVAAGPMTFFRMSTDDKRGRIKAYLGQGEFTADRCSIDGGSAVCRVPGLRNLLGYLCRDGFEHHVAMARGRCAGILEEAIATYLQWDLYVHGGDA